MSDSSADVSDRRIDEHKLAAARKAIKASPADDVPRRMYRELRVFEIVVAQLILLGEWRSASSATKAVLHLGRQIEMSDDEALERTDALLDWVLEACRVA